MLGFLCTLIWAAFGRVDIVAVAQGRIIPSGYTKVIQPLELGRVVKIHVADGERVERGDILVELDAERAMSADRRSCPESGMAPAPFCRQWLVFAR